MGATEERLNNRKDGLSSITGREAFFKQPHLTVKPRHSFFIPFVSAISSSKIKVFMFIAYLRLYAIISIDSTIFILEMECRGIAAAGKQAPTERIAASTIGRMGIAAN